MKKQKKAQSNNYIKRNQVHQPPPKKRCVDEQGNIKRKMWLKDGHTTMLFVDGLTEEAYKVLINSINSTLISLGGKAIQNNRFLITR